MEFAEHVKIDITLKPINLSFHRRGVVPRV